MKLFFLCAFLLQGHARAAVYPIFSQSQAQATFMLAGLTADPDAQAMFQALAAGPQDEQGKWTKKARYTDRGGATTLSVVCVFSKLVPGNGSCTLVLKGGEGMRIDFNAQTVLYAVEDPAEAAKLAALFLPAASGDFFRTGNGRLVMRLDRDAGGAPVRFGLSYR